MNKILQKKRHIFDYLPSNLFFYYCFLKPIMVLAKQIEKGPYGYKDILQSSRLITKACLKTGVEINLSGVEHLTKKPRIIVANHMSSLETLILPYLTKEVGPVSFVIKQELLTKKYFQYIMLGMKCIPMTRTNPRQDLKTLFEQGEKLLNEGISIIIFPQKTRNVTFDPNDFNSIGCKLALRNNVPIQPLALKTDFMASSKLIKDFGTISRQKKIYFNFGELLNISKNNQQEIHQKCISFIKKSPFHCRINRK